MVRSFGERIERLKNATRALRHDVSLATMAGPEVGQYVDDTGASGFGQADGDLVLALGDARSIVALLESLQKQVEIMRRAKKEVENVRA